MTVITEETGQRLLEYLQRAQLGIITPGSVDPIPPEFQGIIPQARQVGDSRFKADLGDLREWQGTAPDPRITSPAALVGRTYPPQVQEGHRPEGPANPSAASRPASQPAQEPVFSIDVEGLKSALAAPSQTAAQQERTQQRQEDAIFNAAGGGGPQYQRSNAPDPRRPSLAEQEAKAKQDFYDTTGYMPKSLGVRHTAQGPVVTMNAKDYQATMRWLDLKASIADAKIRQQRAEGKDPALERQFRREDFQQEMASLRDQQRQAAEERKTAQQEKVQTRRAQNDVGTLVSTLSGPNATPGMQALARYVTAKAPDASGAPALGGGFDPGFLALVQQGLGEAHGVAAGREIKPGTGDRLRPTEEATRNMSEYLRQLEEQVSSDMARQDTKRRAVDIIRAADTTQALQAVPNADVMKILQGLPSGYSVPNPGGQPYTRNPQEAVTEASTLLGDVAHASALPDLSKVSYGPEGFGGAMQTTTSSYAPLRPNTAGVIPRNVKAALDLQNILKSNTPVRQAVLALMWGQGNAAQRDRLLRFVQSQTGLDNEDIAVRTVESDPKWAEIIDSSVNTYLKYRRAEGR